MSVEFDQIKVPKGILVMGGIDPIYYTYILPIVTCYWHGKMTLQGNTMHYKKQVFIEPINPSSQVSKLVAPKKIKCHLLTKSVLLD